MHDCPAGVTVRSSIPRFAADSAERLGNDIVVETDAFPPERFQVRDGGSNQSGLLRTQDDGQCTQQRNCQGMCATTTTHRSGIVGAICFTDQIVGRDLKGCDGKSAERGKKFGARQSCDLGSLCLRDLFSLIPFYGCGKAHGCQELF